MGLCRLEEPLQCASCQTQANKARVSDVLWCGFKEVVLKVPRGHGSAWICTDKTRPALGPWLPMTAEQGPLSEWCWVWTSMSSGKLRNSGSQEKSKKNEKKLCNRHKNDTLIQGPHPKCLHLNFRTSSLWYTQSLQMEALDWITVGNRESPWWIKSLVNVCCWHELAISRTPEPQAQRRIAKAFPGVRLRGMVKTSSEPNVVADRVCRKCPPELSTHGCLRPEDSSLWRLLHQN